MREEMSASTQNRVHVGISGWSNPAFYGLLYPERLPASAMLAQYAKWFTTVEVNNTFYNLPSFSLCDRWHRETPSTFTFSIKANRAFTQNANLSLNKRELDGFIEVISRLKEKLGPILFQFPKRIEPTAAAMEDFLDFFPAGYRYAVELRSSPKEKEDILKILEDHGVSAVVHDFDGESTIRLTSDFVYVRLHGPITRYQGSYTVEQIKIWVDRAAQWLDSGHDVFIYFNNTMHGDAVGNALTFKELLHGHPKLAGRGPMTWSPVASHGDPLSPH